MIDLKLFDTELAQLLGPSAIKSVSGKMVYFIDWDLVQSADVLACKALLFGWFFGGMDTIIDVEESPIEIPSFVLPINGARGVGHICQVRPTTDLYAGMVWLERQLWLAISWHRTKPTNLRIEWEVERLFRDSEAATRLLQSNNASRLIATYHDGDEWLLATLDTEKIAQ